MDSILLFGDSVFFGSGASCRSKGSGRLLVRGMSPKIINKSFIGKTSIDGVTEIDALISDYPDCLIIIIMFGNNDCRLQSIDCPQVSIREYKNNLSEIILRIRNKGRIPYLCNLQPISSEIFTASYPEIAQLNKNLGCSPYQWHKKYSDICEELSEENGVTLIDIRSALENIDVNTISKDGMHPNDIGHKVISDNILRILSAE